MPTCGSDIINCDFPIALNTYKGCAYQCSYCYVNYYPNAIVEIKIDENITRLIRFIKGIRSKKLSWCDWDIPLHWGTLSDPFQPVELEMHESYKRLKLFADTSYPFIFTTKSTIIARPEYLELLKQCNVVGQVSLVSPKYKLFEPYAPSYQDRLNMLPILAKAVKRLIIRCQPYLFEVKADVINALQKYRDSGADGLIITMMVGRHKLPGTIKYGNRMGYDSEKVIDHFLQIKEQCHKVGLKFYTDEEWESVDSDSLTCCGTAGLDGFRSNEANKRRGTNIQYTEQMKQAGTGEAFRDFWRAGGPYRKWCGTHSYMEVLAAIMREEKIIDGSGKEFQL